MKRSVSRASRTPRELTDFGIWVKRRLLDKNMTSRVLCQAVGISQEVYLSRILHGDVSGEKYIDQIVNHLQQ